MRRFNANLGAPSNGVFPRRRRESNLIYETPISTIENPAQAAAWISRPQIHQERPRHTAQPPPRGAQTPDARLIPYAWPPRLQTPDACNCAARRGSGSSAILRACGRKDSGSRWAVSSPTGIHCRKARLRGWGSLRAAKSAARWCAAGRGGCCAKVSGSTRMSLRNQSNLCSWRAIPSPGKNLPMSKRIF